MKPFRPIPKSYEEPEPEITPREVAGAFAGLLVALLVGIGFALLLLSC